MPAAKKAESGVVKTEDVKPKKTPQSFDDLLEEDLLQAANYFGSDTEGGREGIKASLAEDGVTWSQYVKAFKLEGHEDIPDEEEVFPEPVDIEDALDDDELEVNVTGGESSVNDRIVTKPQVEQLAPAQKYLIKMTRKNPYFEFKHYKFTQDKPYAVMSAEDAQDILSNEDGFRQAFPKELQEFYS